MEGLFDGTLFLKDSPGQKDFTLGLDDTNTLIWENKFIPNNALSLLTLVGPSDITDATFIVGNDTAMIPDTPFDTPGIYSLGEYRCSFSCEMASNAGDTQEVQFDFFDGVSFVRLGGWENKSLFANSNTMHSGFDNIVLDGVQQISFRFRTKRTSGGALGVTISNMKVQLERIL